MERKELKRDIKDSEREKERKGLLLNKESETERERARRPICLKSEREGEKEREKRPMIEWGKRDAERDNDYDRKEEKGLKKRIDIEGENKRGEREEEKVR